MLSLLWPVGAGIGAGMAMAMGRSRFAPRTGNHHQGGVLFGFAPFAGHAGTGAGLLLLDGVSHDATGVWRLLLLIAARVPLIVSPTFTGGSG